MNTTYLLCKIYIYILNYVTRMCSNCFSVATLSRRAHPCAAMSAAICSAKSVRLALFVVAKILAFAVLHVFSLLTGFVAVLSAHKCNYTAQNFILLNLSYNNPCRHDTCRDRGVDFVWYTGVWYTAVTRPPPSNK